MTGLRLSVALQLLARDSRLSSRRFDTRLDALMTRAASERALSLAIVVLWLDRIER
jgi:hypothetical protein